jgi:hypothetical protein
MSSNDHTEGTRTPAKLLVSWIRELGCYVSREFYYVMRDLIEVRGWRHVEPWVLMQHSQSPEEKLRELCGEVPSVVLFWETYDLVNAIAPAVRSLGCRIEFFADDLHLPLGGEDVRDTRLRALMECDGLLTPYAYRLGHYYPELRDRTFARWVPHAASPDFVLPFNDEPANRILVSGFVGAPYPLRSRMKGLAMNGWGGIEHHPHPGYREDYDYASDSRVGPGYAAKIRSFRAAFTDAAIYSYVVAKHFEIPATGALLVADGAVREPLRQLGFIDGVHYMATSMEDLETRVEYVLDERNRREIDRIRCAGQKLVLARHKTRHRSTLIDRLVTTDVSPSPEQFDIVVDRSD